MTELADKLDCHALVELFGHQRIAGRVSETTIAGGAFVRVDVPAVGEDKAHTRLYSPQAIYSINPVSEEVATAMATALRKRPVERYELPQIEAPKPSHSDCPHCAGLRDEDHARGRDSYECTTCGRFAAPSEDTLCPDCRAELDGTAEDLREDDIPFDRHPDEVGEQLGDGE
jgi:hypothetical protein